MHRKRWMGMLVVAVAVSGLSVVDPAGAVARASLVRVGLAPRLPTGARIQTQVRAARRLTVLLALKPRHASALRVLAAAVSTPGAAQYGHYLTAAEFARRFGRSSTQIAAVRGALLSRGLSVGTATPNDLTIAVTGTVAQLQRVFSVEEAQVRLKSGRIAYANRQAPRLPADLAGTVQSVLGLDDLVVAQPQMSSTPTSSGPVSRGMRHVLPADRPRAVGNGPAPCPPATTPVNAVGNGAYTADQIAGAYGLTSYYAAGDEGSGQTVALEEFQAYQPSDIAAYQACYGTSQSVVPVNVLGGPPAYNGDDRESTLDIEQIIGLAPRANILVYQAPNTASNFVAVLSSIVSEDRAQSISTSWALCEAAMGANGVIPAENTLLMQAAAQGQSFFASSGDTGSSGCFKNAQLNHTADEYSLAVKDPSSQPFATGVGGTTLLTSDGRRVADGSYPGESVWNDGAYTNVDGEAQPYDATGGGDSTQWAMPSYQSGAAPSLGVLRDYSQGCGGQLCREVPDVSADADARYSGYAFYSDNNWTVNGGTSAAAPLWAAFTALANASAACRGATLGFENPLLYQIASTSYATNFHDITQPNVKTGAASNDAFYAFDNQANPSDLFPVATGYDQATGLGSPIGNALGDSMCSIASPVYTVTVANPGPLTTTVGQSVAVRISATDSGAAGLTYAASGLPAGLSIDSTTGLISGKPTTPQAITVTVVARDGYMNAGSTRFAWRIVARPPPVGKPRTASVRLTGIGRRRAALSFVIQAGVNAPSLRSLEITLPKGLTFARSARSLQAGVILKVGRHRPKFKPTVHKQTLAITFRTAVRTATLMVRRPALTVTQKLAKEIRRHQIKAAVIEISETDATRHTTSHLVRLRRLS